MKPDRASTTYRLDALTFRAPAGGAADEPIRELAANGFPLPAASADKLKRWEARDGRYQLYDDLAVIELAEDTAQAEVKAIARLLGARLYEAAPVACSFWIATRRPGSSTAAAQGLHAQGDTVRRPITRRRMANQHVIGTSR